MNGAQTNNPLVTVITYNMDRKDTFDFFDEDEPAEEVLRKFRELKPQRTRGPNEYREPPKIDPDKIDFSEFHPLDHSIWECKGYPGGRKTHMKYRREFFIDPWIHAHTLCVIGIHTQTGQSWQQGMTWKCCMWCHKALSEKQTQ